jgi:hypothetical protein
MKTMKLLFIGVVALCALTINLKAQSFQVLTNSAGQPAGIVTVTTNASGGLNFVTNMVAETLMTTPILPTSLGDIGGSLGSAPARVATDGYAVFKNFSLTNPISISVIGLKNGSLWGGGIAASTSNTNSLMNAGFGVFAVQTKNAQNQTEWSFYDATLNLQIQQIETIPLLNIPITLRIESGPYVQLSKGGNALGAQSAAFGDLTFGSTKWWITLGAGVVNITGAGLQPILPMAHGTVTFRF